MKFNALPRVTLRHNDQSVVADIAFAATFWRRLRGLVGAPRLSPRCGLLIVPCGSIHMLGMRYPIEAVFISGEFQVLKIARDIRPWIGFCFCLSAYATLEWLPGSAEEFGIQVGDRLRWETGNE